MDKPNVTIETDGAKTWYTAQILFFGRQAIVTCDGNCKKAWGISNRPLDQFSDDPDDIAYKLDSELGDAPEDPGTYEGGFGKPLSVEEFPQKWCVRECERCGMSKIGEPLQKRDYSKLHYNMPWLHPTE